MNGMTRIRKTMVGISIIAAAIAVSASSCDGSTPTAATQTEQNQSAVDLATALKAQPVPHFTWSQIRQTLIDVETAQANVTQTTSFFFVPGVKDPIFTCPSIGLPVPLTDEITNPQQLIGNGGDQNYFGTGVVSQIDPNVVYGGATSATAVICVGPGGKPYIDHAEELVHAVTGAATWDYNKHVIVVTGDPTFKVKVGK
jgi:hypothetical protein